MNTIIITGANRGIGFECAMQMAKIAKSEQIIITSRDITSGHEAVVKIKQTTGHANISVMTIDLASLASSGNLRMILYVLNMAKSVCW